MKYLPPFVIHGTHTITKEEIALHGEDYRKIITALRDDKLDLEKASQFLRLNADTDSLIMEQEK
jgi:glutathione-regulated potassium-efflux system ancillary protein KefG